MKKLIFPLILFSLFVFANCSTENTPIYSLSTNVNPSEAGTISPASGEFDEGTEVEIVANQNEHWVFQEWQGDYSGSQNPISISMDSDKHITAMFFKREYPLIIEIEGEGTVQERIVQQKTTDYPHETIVELEAVPLDGWKFTEWQGDLSGNENPTTITIENETSVKAIFDRKVFSLNIEIEGNGSVAKELVTGNETDNGYEFESEIKITANPYDGWRFKEWRGDIVSNENPVTFTIDEDKNIIAEFEEFPDSPFAGGDGSEIHPFEIETLTQLQEVRNYTDQHFILIADIDASETSSWNGGQGFNPIGDDIVNFTGTFDGNGHTISYLTIDREDDWYLGLFGYIEGGTIENVTLQNVNVSGNERIGGLIGRTNGLVQNSSSNGQVTGRNHVGGLVGLNRGQIQNSYSSGEVSSSNNAGGLVGSNINEVNSSYSTSNVSGTLHRIGGLVGENSGNIIKSYATGEVLATTTVGGLVGWNRLSGEINESFSLGDVSGEERVGGLVGRNDNGNSRIYYSYAQGDVEGIERVGGLVGTNSDDGEIIETYATGSVSGTTDVGGLIGSNGATLSSSYWDLESSGQNEGIGHGNQDGTNGLTTSQMTGSSVEENMSEFDWEDIWKTVSGYPILKWQEN
jgi:hypothetical protein